ncbi:uncharacterized protein LOC143297081 [Babylonia areolata]|uniref:uncharacterized protein LOC143297081 n=1 Tax=Babylonia areolata TaxID=304850 RepID=UPI003FD0FD77
MSEAASNTQAVFLIDLSVCRSRGTKWEEAISLCVFRVLSFLNSQLDTVNKNKTKSLRWGFKLFDIDEKIGKLESRASGFQDFKLKTFQEFETNLKKSLQLLQLTDITVRVENDQDQTKKKGFLLSSHPSSCLLKRLTETVHDFPWEMPDVGSPVKGRKKHGQFETAQQSNYVFLISRVPCDKKTLRHYCNKVVMDKTVFVDAVMPQQLRKQFYEQRKIRLHWIDTGRYRILNEADPVVADKKSYEMVRQSLRTVGALLIPFHSLVTHLSTTTHAHHRPSSSGDAEMLEEGLSGQDSVTVLLSSFACMSVCSAVLPCCHRGKGAVPSSLTGSAASSSLSSSTAATTATLLFEQLGDVEGSEGDKSRTVSLKLVPITKTFARKPQPVTDPQEVEVKTSDGGDGACVLVVPPGPGPAPHPLRAPPSSAPRLQMRGRMERWEVRTLGGNLGQHFLCLAADSVSEDQRRDFLSLLRALSSLQQTLILSVSLDKETCPYLAVLESSSGSSAHLCYLSLGMTLQVEKKLTLKGVTSGEGVKERSGSGICVEQFRKQVTSTLSSRHPQSSEHQSVAGGEGTRGGGSEGGRLWTGVLNPWHMAGSVPQIQSALDTLTDRVQPVSDLSEATKQMLRDLKQAYRRENQPPFFLHPSQQSTPLFPSSSSSAFLPLNRSGSADRSTSSLDSSAERRRSGKQERDSEIRGMCCAWHVCRRSVGSRKEIEEWEAGKRRSGKQDSILTRGRLMVIQATQRRTSSTSGLDEVDGDFLPPAAPLPPPPPPRPSITQAGCDS